MVPEYASGAGVFFVALGSDGVPLLLLPACAAILPGAPAAPGFCFSLASCRNRSRSFFVRRSTGLCLIV